MPEGCLFDHIHNASRCWPFVRWNQTGAAACQERNMQMRSFAMLLPCGISLFSGVEFVCCPKHFKGEWGSFFCVQIYHFQLRTAAVGGSRLPSENVQIYIARDVQSLTFFNLFFYQIVMKIFFSHLLTLASRKSIPLSLSSPTKLKEWENLPHKLRNFTILAVLELKWNLWLLFINNFYNNLLRFPRRSVELFSCV